MQAAFHEQKKNIDIGVKKAKQEWQAAWAAVEGALDIIWTEAKVLKPHADPHAHDYGYSSLHNTPSTSSLKNTPSTTHGPEIPNTPSIQQGSTPDLGMAKFADFPITTPRGSSARARRVCAWRQFPAGAWNEEVVGNKRSSPVELTEWEQEFVNRVEKTVSSTSTAGDIMTPRQKPWKRVMESDDEEGEFRLPKRRSQRNKETNTQNATGPPQGTGGPEAGPSQQRNHSLYNPTAIAAPNPNGTAILAIPTLSAIFQLLSKKRKSTSKPMMKRNRVRPRLATRFRLVIDAWGKIESLKPGIRPMTEGPRMMPPMISEMTRGWRILERG
ncbi:Na-H-Exchanger multi-domain protein [Pyrenophora tritici-repentis]|nr:Na-H-Exchanger multi-domain protein [Pyrenophora tritici-repentis]